jgi:hypothetical protein
MIQLDFGSVLVSMNVNVNGYGGLVWMVVVNGEWWSQKNIKFKALRGVKRR